MGMGEVALSGGIGVIGAFGGSILGGLQATKGAAKVTADDLLVRNRHALLMEDIPRFERARSDVTVRTGSSFPGQDDHNARVEELRLASEQIATRCHLLSDEEASLGYQLDEMLENGVVGGEGAPTLLDRVQLIEEIRLEAKGRLRTRRQPSKP